MATDQTVASTAATTNETPAYQLDVQKLHSLPSEQQDLYLLTFSADLARHVAGLDSEAASAQQTHLKKELFQIINLASPAPTRVIRNNLGACLAGIFSKGNRKLLYESINDLVAILNAGKEKDIRTKHAAVHCLGALFEAAGDSAVSLSSVACSSIIKNLKTAQNHAGMRSAVYKALGGVVRGIGASVDETIAREAWKSARSAAASDKSLLVQVSACWCLEQFVAFTPYYDNSTDFEKLQTAVWKAMDSPSKPVRHAAASALSTVLVKAFSETPNKDIVLKIKKPKKAKKTGQDDDPTEEIERTASPAMQKPVTAVSFNLMEILRILSTRYTLPATSNRGRAAIAVCYKYILTSLGETVVESHYSQIARHLFSDILGHPAMIFHRHRQLVARKHVRIILQDILEAMLGETAQINAARFTINDILKDYPQSLKERPEPTKQTLTGALCALTSLIGRLGAAFGPLAEPCREALLQVLQHPSYTVQVHASRCFRAFVMACPQQLLPSVTICMNSVNRELGLLSGPKQSPRRCVGYANGLAAILSTSNQHPLYGSVDVYARVLSQATTLLKSSGSSNLRISSTQIQVAWVMIGGLMSLGPNFVKIHLSQLMLLWKNALTPPASRDELSKRNLLELSFLAHVRECALGSMMAFLHFNGRLLTSDVSKRLAILLQNTALFVSSLPAKKLSEDGAGRLSPALQLQDLELMVRRRIFQCYTSLLTSNSLAASEMAQQSNVLPLAVLSFADPDNYAPSSLSVSIASSAGNYESVWDVGDNSGFGVNGLRKGLELKPISYQHGDAQDSHWTSTDDSETIIDRTLRLPICEAWEHDSVSNYLSVGYNSNQEPQPPATEVVNAGISLFALALPLQSPRLQESILEQLSTFLFSSNAQRDPARKSAVSINIATALLLTVRVLHGQTTGLPGNVQSATAEKAMQTMLHTFITDPDEHVRFIAAEALGRLCSVSGSDLTNTEVSYLIDAIVSNPEPQARAGCALALASIHSQLGGMAAGYHLKNILGILMSLAADQHPVVHFWALESLCRIIDSAGLTFSGYVSSSVGLLGQLYVVDSHNAETASQLSSNMEVKIPTTAVTARCVDAIVNVLGPDLQDMTKPRDMILTLTRQFQGELDSLVLVESMRCLEHISLYAPSYMEFHEYVRQLQTDLDSQSAEVNSLAITGLANLMQRDSQDVVQIADAGLEDKLWDLLDDQPDHLPIKRIFSNWLQQTGLSDTAGWIQRCSTVLTKSKARVDRGTPVAPQKQTPGPDIQDDEVAGFAASSGAKEEDAPAATSSQELMRWQVRLFAMDLLTTLFGMVAKDAMINDESPAFVSLQEHIGDVVRIAFSASTAGVVSLRVRGLRIIDSVLKMFGGTPDPDFTEAMLLEQYQAQISSALTPAFSADSSPELAAEAVNVCATFISTGIVTDVDRMGRILKLLVSALDTFSTESESASIGDLKALSSNAQVMVRMSLFSAWAGLQIATAEHRYLVDVVKPHVARLTPLWLASLTEFARLRFEPDISSTSGVSMLSQNLDTMYAALNRETLLKFYQDSWLKLVDAIASLIDEDSEFVFDALDGKTNQPATNGDSHHHSEINYREEPAAFFFVLYGLAFEALAGRSSGDELATSNRNLDILSALKKILRPSVSGNAIYQEVVFSETMDLLDRMVLTEGMDVQTVIVEIARNMCLAHPSSRLGSDKQADDENLSEDIEQLFELTRIIVLVLAGLVPGLAESNRPTRAEITDEAVVLIRLSLNALVDASEVFPSIIKGDLHSCIFHLFVTILGTGSCQATVVPQVLPIFRRFVNGITFEGRSETRKQIRSTLGRFLTILRNAQKRETEASLPCEKNTILAGTILVTTAHSLLAAGDPIVSRFVSEIADSLDNRMTTKMASGCARSLLLIPGKQLSIPAQLLPRLIKFLTNPADLEGLPESRSIIVQSLITFATAFAAPRKPAMFAVAISTLLTRASKEGEATHRETATRLLELAGADPDAFRAVVNKLDAEQKTFMEKIIREGQGRQTVKRTDTSDEREPTIALKMDF